MKTQSLLQEVAIRNGANRMILLLFFCSVICNMLLSAVLVTRGMVVQNILTPPEIRRTLKVSNVAFSKEYLEEMAPYHAYLLLNNTPQNVDYQNQQLLRYAAAEYKDALEKELGVKARWHKRNNISTYFTGVSAAGDTNDNTVVLKGVFEIKRNDKIVDRKDRELLLSYRNSNGTIELLSIKEVRYPNSRKNTGQDVAEEEPKVQTETVTVESQTEDFKGSSHDVPN